MSTLRIEKTSNYSIISNIHVQDKNLSWKAKGLMNYLLSLPNDWQIYIEHLKNQSTDGRESTSSGIKELMETGYITRDYKRDDSGKFSGYAYVVRESPTKQDNIQFAEKPITENPFSVFPISENPTLYKTDGTPLEITNLTNDERQPPSLKLKQKNNHTQTIKTRSSSVVNVESFKDNNNEQVETLFNLVPKHNQSGILKTEIAKRLNAGFTVEAIKEALEYTILRSKGTPTQFKAYFGQTLDYGYDADYQARKEEKEQEQKQKRQLENDRKERERLKALNERREIEEIKAQNESRKKALESLKANFPDKYKETQDKAFEIYKKKYPNMKADRAALSIKIEMCKILSI